ncbi:hypothetical protein EFB08_16615 [Rufibacter latericius]|uniref:DUF748 domain-containing protein n=2 Tax=Rufibacter latericius TaxID=2487040 RepID=A0A3M9MG96_9BACT|nr:hypothetical protein EFB08_16615 [Rufibacter latericius]
MVAGAIVLVLLVGLLVVSKNLNAWAAKKLVKQVHTQSKGMYDLRMSHLEVSVLAGSATLDSVRLIPNPKVWKQMQQRTPAQAPASLSEVKAAKVQVGGIPFLKLLFGGAFGLSSVQLESPEWELRQMKQDTSSKPLHERVGKQFREMAIREIQIKNGSFRYRDKAHRKTDVFSLSGVNLKASGVKLDSASFQDPSRAFYSKEIDLTAKEAAFSLPNGFYRIKTGLSRVSTQKKELIFSRVQLVPLLSAAGMSRKAGMAVTRFSVHVPEVRLSKVDFANLSQNANFYVGGVAVQNPRVSAYKDGKHFASKGNGLMPHDLVQKIPFGVNIREVNVRNLAVRYEELSEKALRTGYVTGSNIDLTLTNLTNDKNLISLKNPAVLKARGFIMGKAAMQATVRLALLDPNGYHSIEGTIGKGYPAILNPIIEPSMFVSVKSGYVQKGSFKVELTKTSATGRLQLQYDDFKVDLLSKDKEKKQSFGKKIKTLLADKLVLKSDSENNGKAPREGKIEVKRKSERSFLTYWKDCLANGVLSVIGAPM